MESVSQQVTFEDVHLRYGDIVALDGVDFSLPRGGVCALLGPNGAGKTSSVSLLLALTQPDSGRIDVGGFAPGTSQARQQMGAMLQVSGVPPTLEVGELISLFASYYADPMRKEHVLALTDLAALESRRYGKLSGGQQQRVLFALSLCGDPDLLVLDEPTVGMDVSVRRSFWQVIRDCAADGKTVLLTTHYLEEADAVADQIVLLRAGRVAASGSPTQIKSTVSARRIRAATQLPDATLEALPGVIEVQREGSRVSVLSNSPEVTLRRWFAADDSLSDLEVRGAALEEAFVALTTEEPPA